MKKYLLIILCSFSFYSFAQEGSKYIFGGMGRQRNMIEWKHQFLNFNLGIEFEGRYHTAWEVYIDISSKYKNCKSCKITNYRAYDYNSFGLGVAYKSVIIRGKKSQLRWKAGVDIGSNIKPHFQTSIDIGLEYSYTFKNNMKLYILQKNDFVFWNKSHFQNGLVMGVKFPIN